MNWRNQNEPTTEHQDSLNSSWNFSSPPLGSHTVHSLRPLTRIHWWGEKRSVSEPLNQNTTRKNRERELTVRTSTRVSHTSGVVGERRALLSPFSLFILLFVRSERTNKGTIGRREGSEPYGPVTTRHPTFHSVPLGFLVLTVPSFCSLFSLTYSLHFLSVTFSSLCS